MLPEDGNLELSKKNLDLDTIKDKLKHKVYGSFFECLDDINKLLRNSQEIIRKSNSKYLFNSP